MSGSARWHEARTDCPRSTISAISEWVERSDGEFRYSLAVGPGALWVVNDEASILQRFDRPT